MDSFSSNLMWDEATRDLQAEQTEFARTAALADVDPLWPLFADATNESDLGNRLALADDSIRAAAARRGYSAADLTADLTKRWALLTEARALSAPAPQARPQQPDRSGPQLTRYLNAVGRLTAQAALDNPGLPLHECQQLAEEAIAKTADAYPLAYENFGHVADGPITDRVKNWQPPKLPKPGGGAVDPEDGPDGQMGLFPAPKATPSATPAAVTVPSPPEPAPSHINQTLF